MLIAVYRFTCSERNFYHQSKRKVKHESYDKIKNCFIKCLKIAQFALKTHDRFFLLNKLGNLSKKLELSRALLNQAFILLLEKRDLNCTKY